MEGERRYLHNVYVDGDVANYHAIIASTKVCIYALHFQSTRSFGVDRMDMFMDHMGMFNVYSLLAYFMYE